MQNPIISAVATEAAAKEWPISGITVVSPMISAQPLLVINWAKMQDINGACLGVPREVTVMGFQRVPETILKLVPLTDMEGMVIAAAWQHGAWDIKRTTIVSDYHGALPPYLADIKESVAREGYVAWYWRPLLGGPDIRARANGHRDRTLNSWSLGRDGEPTSVRTSRLRANHQEVIKLGMDPAEKRHATTLSRGRKATTQQRGYLGRLLREAGEDDALPPGMTIREASAAIDRLVSNRKRRKN